jgi:hypothetical protein
MAYRHRALEARLKKYLGLFPAIAVTGPRQSGKSTLLQTAFPDLLVYDRDSHRFWVVDASAGKIDDHRSLRPNSEALTERLRVL